MCKEEYAKAISTKLYSREFREVRLMHVIAAKAVCFGEALKARVQRISEAGSE